jgi:hypothetical protein
VTPPQAIAAAWHSLIAGARGIIWFQHNFSGPCQDYRTFTDGSSPSSSMYNCQQTPGVTLHDLVTAISGFDHEVLSLNDVLLSPTAVGYVSTTGDVSTMAKAYGGSCYVFAGSGQPINPPPANQSVTFNLADGYTGPVTVHNESRTLTASGGNFHDTFADANSVHIYRIADASTCARTRIASLTASPVHFRAAAVPVGDTSMSSGTTISYFVSTPSSTVFTISRSERGFARGSRCAAKLRKRTRHPRRCVRFVRVGGEIVRDDQAGPNQFRFSGWIGVRKLSPGLYRLQAIPRLASGEAGASATCAFRILA